ncbi:SDR family NAD(P)-dependent oxidoreductase [Catellatospora methionotrophica]|uniref:SDR family NAD(P)-dependent oxidoreductase n=1 Tax=Catellatospora methionotrophica TaxID=121620 RepID=UPI0033EF9425
MALAGSVPAAAVTAFSRRFDGSRVLVTGGGRGIGRVVALAFAAEGARVAVASRTATELDRVAAEIGEVGAAAMTVPCDVSDPDHARAAVVAVTEGFGGLDILINCAGIFRMGESEHTEVTTTRDLLAVNALGTMLMCQEAGRHMLSAGGGRIVNFASLLSFTAFPARAAYAASKGAVLQLTRVLGVEWAGRGVTVNAIAPGMIAAETPHPAVGAGSLAEDAIVRRIPMGRRGRPEDISGPVLFLCSSAADYITGQALVVDGGWLSYGYV